MKELLVTCPLCHRTGFSPRGLRVHYCRATKMRRRLTLKEWEHATEWAQEYRILCGK